MKLNAYTLFDTKSLVFNTPFFTHTHGAATRMCADLVADLNTTVGRHPADYVLYCIGQYDDEKGALVPHEIREHVVDIVSLVPMPGPDVLSTLNKEPK